MIGQKGLHEALGGREVERAPMALAQLICKFGTRAQKDRFLSGINDASEW